MWAAEYLSDAIGRKPVSEGTTFPSAHCARWRRAHARERGNEVPERALRPCVEGRKPVSEETEFPSAHCDHGAKGGKIKEENNKA